MRLHRPTEEGWVYLAVVIDSRQIVGFAMSERMRQPIRPAEIFDRRTVRYSPRRPADAELRQKLHDLANASRRFGYRRLFVLLRLKGETSGKNRIYRLYREEGLTVRKRRARGRAVGTRAPIPVEARPNALVAGLRARSVRLRTAVPHPQRRRRRDARMPGGTPRHLDLERGNRA